MEKTLNHVYIFGAGASHACGIPLAKELISEAIAIYSADAASFSHTFTKEEIRAAIDWINSEFGDPNEIDINSEEVLNRLYQKKPSKTARDCIESLIYKTIQEKTRQAINICINGKVRDAYGWFCERKLNPNNNISFISFNYDNLLKSAMLWNGPSDFDYGIDFDEHEKTRSKNSGILFAKPSGSFDMQYCDKCYWIKLYWHKDYENMFEGKCHRCKNGLKPLLIAPCSREDLFKHKKFSLLKEKIKACLRNANIITIIGYSFPEYDKGFIRLFKNAIQSNSNDLNIQIVDPKDPDSEDVSEGFSELLKNKAAKKIANSFEDFVRTV